jgi:pimeloyl-ACP methyl ester carboxylesterase
VEFLATFDDASVTDLRDRLARARFPEPATMEGWSQGVPLAEMRRLTAYWRDGYDWERLRARLTSVPQIMVSVDGLDVHAIHVRSSRPDAVPLLLTHGWPSTCYEFLEVIPLLTEPDDGPAFHVVCPSLPGYGFSGRPDGPGWDADRIADAWATLMTELGHDHFVAQGGDWGALVSTQLAIRHRDRLLGLHLTMPLATSTHGDRADVTPFEQHGLDRERDYRRSGFAYAVTQCTRPQTIGYALVDSPVALCAWVVEKLHDWSGRDEAGQSLLDDDTMLDIVSVYWLTGTGASSARLYLEALRMDLDVPVDVPTGCSIFAHEIIRPPRSAVARRYRDLRSWQEVARGGHFAASEVPQEFAHQVQAFVTLL